MKPFQILLSMILVVACLGVVVWIGRFNGMAVPVAETTQSNAAATPEDLPMPKTGPYGKAEIDETVFNFGVRLVGSNDEHEFTLKNSGQGNLDFALGKPTCQCTGVEVTKNGSTVEDKKGTMAPGESIMVQVKWVMKSRMEAFRHGVKVFTTDPDNRTIDLAVQGQVNSAFALRPEGIWDLGELSTSAPSTSEGKLLSPVFDDFTVEELPRENSHVKISFSALDEEALKNAESKSGYSIHVEVAPGVPVGSFREMIKLKASNDKESQEIDFVVAGKRSGPLDIRGVKPDGVKFNPLTNRLILGEFPAVEGKTAKMTLFVKGLDKDLELLGIEPAETQIKAKLTEGKTLGKSRGYQLEIEIPPGPAVNHQGEKMEIIVLKFNHPEAPEYRMLIDYNSLR